MRYFLIYIFLFISLSVAAQSFTIEATSVATGSPFLMSVDDILYIYSAGSNSVVKRKYGTPDTRIVEPIDSIIQENCILFKCQSQATSLYYALNKMEIEQMERTSSGNARILLKTNNFSFITVEPFDTIVARIFVRCAEDIEIFLPDGTIVNNRDTIIFNADQTTLLGDGMPGNPFRVNLDTIIDVARLSISATSPILYNPVTGVVSIQTANTSQSGAISSTDWNTFNNKQNQLNGTGFVRMNGTTVSYITGTSSQFIKADGSLDGTTYISTSGLSGTNNQFAYFNGTNSVTSSSLFARASDGSGVNLNGNLEILSTNFKLIARLDGSTNRKLLLYQYGTGVRVGSVYIAPMTQTENWNTYAPTGNNNFVFGGGGLISTGNSLTLLGYEAGNQITTATSSIFITTGQALVGFQTGNNIISIGSGGIAAAASQRIIQVGYISQGTLTIPDRSAVLGSGSAGADYTNNFYLGLGYSNPNLSNNLSVTLQPTLTEGTNGSGMNLRVASARGTGTGALPDIIFSTPTLGVSGSTLQTLTDRWWLKGGTGTLANTSSPHASTTFQLVSTSLGAINAPVMTNTQMLAVSSPAQGLRVYNSTNEAPAWYNSTAARWEFPAKMSAMGVNNQVAYWASGLLTGSNNFSYNGTLLRLENGRFIIGSTSDNASYAFTIAGNARSTAKLEVGGNIYQTNSQTSYMGGIGFGGKTALGATANYNADNFWMKGGNTTTPSYIAFSNTSFSLSRTHAFIFTPADINTDLPAFVSPQGSGQTVGFVGANMSVTTTPFGGRGEIYHGFNAYGTITDTWSRGYTQIGFLSNMSIASGGQSMTLVDYQGTNGDNRFNLSDGITTIGFIPTTARQRKGIFQVNTNRGGILPPRYTTAQRDAMASSVTAVNVVVPGTGCTDPNFSVNVTFSGGGGQGAKASVQSVSAGGISAFRMQDGGYGYTSAPTVTLTTVSGGTCTGATATATIGTSVPHTTLIYNLDNNQYEYWDSTTNVWRGITTGSTYAGWRTPDFRLVNSGDTVEFANTAATRAYLRSNQYRYGVINDFSANATWFTGYGVSNLGGQFMDIFNYENVSNSEVYLRLLSGRVSGSGTLSTSQKNDLGNSIYFGKKVSGTGEAYSNGYSYPFVIGTGVVDSINTDVVYQNAYFAINVLGVGTQQKMIELDRRDYIIFNRYGSGKAFETATGILGTDNTGKMVRVNPTTLADGYLPTALAAGDVTVNTNYTFTITGSAGKTEFDNAQIYMEDPTGDKQANLTEESLSIADYTTNVQIGQLRKNLLSVEDITAGHINLLNYDERRFNYTGSNANSTVREWITLSGGLVTGLDQQYRLSFGNRKRTTFAVLERDTAAASQMSFDVKESAVNPNSGDALFGLNYSSRSSNSKAPSLLFTHKVLSSPGTNYTETFVSSGGDLGEILFGSGNTTNYIGAKIWVEATENQSATAMGSKIIFTTVANTTTAQVDRLTIDQDGTLIFHKDPTDNNALTKVLGRNSVTGAIEERDFLNGLFSAANSGASFPANMSARVASSSSFGFEYSSGDIAFLIDDAGNSIGLYSKNFDQGIAISNTSLSLTATSNTATAVFNENRSSGNQKGFEYNAVPEDMTSLTMPPKVYVDQARKTIFTPSSGDAVSAVKFHINVINPSGGIAALTINTPGSPVDGDTFEVIFKESVTTITWGTGTVVKGITTAINGTRIKLVYNGADSSWY